METIAKTNIPTNAEVGFQLRKVNRREKIHARKSVPKRITDTLSEPVVQLSNLYNALNIAPGGLKPDQSDMFLEIRHQATHLIKQVDHMVELINLRSQIHNEEERNHLKNIICRIPDDIIYEEALHHAQTWQRLSDISIHIHSAPVEVHSDHLRIMMRELIQNAFQYSDPETEVDVTSTLSDNYLIIEVKDQGYGMSQKKSEMLNRNISADTDGLGLQIVHEILSVINGSFSLFSIPHRGTSVKVSLPLSE